MGRDWFKENVPYSTALQADSTTSKLGMMDKEKAEILKSFALVFNDNISFTLLEWLNCKTGNREAEFLPV